MVLIIVVPNHKCFDQKPCKTLGGLGCTHIYGTLTKKACKNFLKNITLWFLQFPLYFDSFYVSLLSSKYKYKSSRPVQRFLLDYILI